MLSAFLRRFVLSALSKSDLYGKDKKAELAKAIKHYLDVHPTAMDNLQGIAEWWVTRREAPFEMEVLANVLLELVAQGVLEKVEATSGSLYRLSGKAHDHSAVP